MKHQTALLLPKLIRVNKVVAAILIYSFLSSSCNVLQVVHLLKTGKVEQKNYYQEIPYEVRDRMILLEVNINGVFYHFVPDTGAPTIISEDLAKKAGIKEKCRVNSSDSQGNESTLGFSKIKEIRLGQINYLNQGVAIYDFNDMRELSCYKIDGVLGANTMKNSIWQFDLKNNVLRITNTIDSLKIPDKALQFTFRQQLTGTPVLSVEVDGIPLPDLTLDYGSDYGIEIVSEQLFDSIIKENIPIRKTFGYGSLGLYGGKNDTLYTFQLPEVFIGGQSFTDQSIRLGKSGESTIGIDFLKNYLVTIDWIDKTVYMEKIDDEPPTAETVSYGFNVIWQDGILVVAKLIENTPAYEAGVQLGDQVLSINEVDYSQVRPDQYCAIVKYGLIDKDVKAVELVFKRDTVTKKVLMRLTDSLFQL